MSDNDGDEKTYKKWGKKKQTTVAGRTKEEEEEWEGQNGGKRSTRDEAPQAEGDRNIYTGTIQTLGMDINTSVGYSRQRAFCRRLSFMAVL